MCFVIKPFSYAVAASLSKTATLVRVALHNLLPIKQSSNFAHMQVVTANGDVGTIEGSFGKSGKFKVSFPGGVRTPASGSNSIRLTFKKFIFDKDKWHMAQ